MDLTSAARQALLDRETPPSPGFIANFRQNHSNKTKEYIRAAWSVFRESQSEAAQSSNKSPSRNPAPSAGAPGKSSRSRSGEREAGEGRRGRSPARSNYPGRPASQERQQGPLERQPSPSTGLQSSIASSTPQAAGSSAKRARSFSPPKTGRPPERGSRNTPPQPVTSRSSASPTPKKPRQRTPSRPPPSLDPSIPPQQALQPDPPAATRQDVSPQRSFPSQSAIQPQGQPVLQGILPKAFRSSPEELGAIRPDLNTAPQAPPPAPPPQAPLDTRPPNWKHRPRRRPKTPPPRVPRLPKASPEARAPQSLPPPPRPPPGPRHRRPPSPLPVDPNTGVRMYPVHTSQSLNLLLEPSSPRPPPRPPLGQSHPPDNMPSSSNIRFPSNDPTRVPHATGSLDQPVNPASFNGRLNTSGYTTSSGSRVLGVAPPSTRHTYPSGQGHSYYESRPMVQPPASGQSVYSGPIQQDSSYYRPRAMIQPATSDQTGYDRPPAAMSTNPLAPFPRAPPYYGPQPRMQPATSDQTGYDRPPETFRQEAFYAEPQQPLPPPISTLLPEPPSNDSARAPVTRVQDPPTLVHAQAPTGFGERPALRGKSPQS